MANLTKALTQTCSGLLLAVAVAMSANAGDLQKLINTGAENAAVKGYDTVAYFTEGKPMMGKAEFAYLWNDANWHFTSSAHRDLFVANPERYAPQFGGFCSMALVAGKVKDIDPEAWTIVDGKLYLNFTKAFRDKFRKDAAESIKKAEENWTKSVKHN